MRIWTLLIRSTAIIGLLAGASISAGGVLYVDADSAGWNNGSSWANAYVYLQDAIGDAYFDAWVEIIDDADVPLAPGCLRLEGSANAPCDALGTADDDNVGFGDRHYVIDVEKGSVALIGLFGGDFGGALDVHLFRVVEGLIDRIHTATVFHDPDSVSATGWDPY